MFKLSSFVKFKILEYKVSIKFCCSLGVKIFDNGRFVIITSSSVFNNYAPPFVVIIF